MLIQDECAPSLIHRLSVGWSEGGQLRCAESRTKEKAGKVPTAPLPLLSPCHTLLSHIYQVFLKLPPPKTVQCHSVVMEEKVMQKSV